MYFTRVFLFYVDIFLKLYLTVQKFKFLWNQIYSPFPFHIFPLILEGFFLSWVYKYKYSHILSCFCILTHDFVCRRNVYLFQCFVFQL